MRTTRGSAHARSSRGDRSPRPRGGIRVFDEDGARVDTDASVPGTEDPFLGGVALQDDLDEGSYIVTWRAVSVDGQRIRGAFVFTVGGATQASDTLVADLLSGDGGAVALVQRLATGLTYAAVLFLVGALLASSVLGRAATQRSAAWVRRAMYAAIGLSVLAVPLQAMATSGDGLSAAFDGAQLWTVLSSSVGLAAVVRVTGLLGVLLTSAESASVPDWWRSRPSSSTGTPARSTRSG